MEYKGGTTSKNCIQDGEINCFAVPLGNAVSGADFMACIHWFLIFCLYYFVVMNTSILFV